MRLRAAHCVLAGYSVRPSVRQSGHNISAAPNIGTLGEAGQSVRQAGNVLDKGFVIRPRAENRTATAN